MREFIMSLDKSVIDGIYIAMTIIAILSFLIGLLGLAKGGGGFPKLEACMVIVTWFVVTMIYFDLVDEVSAVIEFFGRIILTITG